MIENLIPWMVAFPLLAGIVLLFISGDALRRYAVYAATAAIMAGSVLLASMDLATTFNCSRAAGR